MALNMASNHVSLYELTIKSGTPIYRDYKLGKYAAPTSDTMANMYETTIQVAKSFGFNQYEVSNFERKGNFSKHNFGYWSGLDYLGIGPGAHGRIYDPLTTSRTRTYNILYPEEWMTRCEELGHGMRKSVRMTIKDTKEELILFGLRTKIGITRSRFRMYSNGQELEQYLNMKKVNSFVQDGFLTWENGKYNANRDDNIDSNLKVNIPLLCKGNNSIKRRQNNETSAPYSNDKDWVLSDLTDELNDGGLRPTEKGLAVIDEIVPRILI